MLFRLCASIFRFSYHSSNVILAGQHLLWGGLQRIHSIGMFHNLGYEDGSFGHFQLRLELLVSFSLFGLVLSLVPVLMYDD